MHPTHSIAAPAPSEHPRPMPSAPEPAVGAVVPRSTHLLTYDVLRLDLPARGSDVPKLRRFINLFIGQQNDLFHNHRTANTYWYRYPLVQYKAVENKAALYGWSETGQQALQMLLAQDKFRQHCEDFLGAGALWPETHRETLCLQETRMHTCQLRQYIALNEHNLKTWHERTGLKARAELLERCLTAHLLKYCTAIGWQLPAHSLNVELLDYRTRPVRSFDNRFMAFDLDFRCNLALPDQTGLGKAVSHGFGILTNR